MFSSKVPHLVEATPAAREVYLPKRAADDVGHGNIFALLKNIYIAENLTTSENIFTFIM